MIAPTIYYMRHDLLYQVSSIITHAPFYMQCYLLTHAMPMVLSSLDSQLYSCEAIAFLGILLLSLFLYFLLFANIVHQGFLNNRWVDLHEIWRVGRDCGATRY